MDKRSEMRFRHWAAILDAQAKSGMNKGEWCAANGVERTSFFRWQKLVRMHPIYSEAYREMAQDPAAGIQPGTGCLVELPHSPSSLPAAAEQHDRHNDAQWEAGSICILHGGFSVLVSGSVDEGILASVLRAVKDAG